MKYYFAVSSQESLVFESWKSFVAQIDMWKLDFEVFFRKSCKALSVLQT